jgi:putative hydrolase of the HAD superfamily
MSGNRQDSASLGAPERAVMAKIDTVIFDLFGTLVDHFMSSVGRMHGAMAEALAVPYEEFDPLWIQTTDMRVIGDFETVEAAIEHVLAAMNAQARPEQIESAVEVRMKSIKDALHPKPQAIETLNELNHRSYRLGLLSNCSVEIPLLWDETAFSAAFEKTVFSCLERLKKPDERIYRLTCERLGVKPQSCLYIADGENYELAAAARVGMEPLLIRPSSQETLKELHREAREWPGPAISTLPEVLDLLEDEIGQS